MFRNLRVRADVPAQETVQTRALRHLWRDPAVPLSIRSLNQLPEAMKTRLFRFLIPPELLQRHDIDLVDWHGPRHQRCVEVIAPVDSGLLHIDVGLENEAGDPFYSLEIQDNAFGGVDINWLMLNDPQARRYDIDRDEAGHDNGYGMIRRNLVAEQAAWESGLAPAQVRRGLGRSREVIAQLEVFLLAAGHEAFFLEPLTYVSAWLFERRGCAYVRGHQLMDEIDRQFQPGKQLHRALDGSTPFRQPEQWRTVRGRAWAIHDGILAAIGAEWDSLRMVKQIGRHAGVDTFPGAVY